MMKMFLSQFKNRFLELSSSKDKFTINYLLTIIVLFNFYLKLFVIFGTIVFVSFYFYRESNQEQIIFLEDGDRNESSTPRSFILPATPAVALDQEARNSDSNVYKSRMSCMKRLIELNYDVGDELIEFNAKLKVAIYEFQKSIKLEPIGILDSKTIEALGC